MVQEDLAGAQAAFRIVAAEAVVPRQTPSEAAEAGPYLAVQEAQPTWGVEGSVEEAAGAPFQAVQAAEAA